MRIMEGFPVISTGIASRAGILTRLASCMRLLHYSTGETAQKPRELLGRGCTLFYICDRRGPPLLDRAPIGSVVTKAVQNGQSLGFRRSLVDALAHPKRIGLIGIAV